MRTEEGRGGMAAVRCVCDDVCVSRAWQDRALRMLPWIHGDEWAARLPCR